MRRLLLCWFAVVFAQPVLAQPTSRVALVIGVGAYQHVPRLHNPARDARAMDSKLRDLGFQTELVIDPDRATLERAIRRLGDKARAADIALVYYAGHAIEVAGQNYLIPVSADLHSSRDVPFETVGLDLIPSQLVGRSLVTLVFVDACRDNPFKLGADERGIASRGLAPFSTNGIGTLVVYATAPGQTAGDGTGDHSPFTTALLHYIDTPGLEIRQIISRVRHEVRELTNNLQVPWESSALEGDIIIRPAPAQQTETVPVQPLPLPPITSPVPVFPVSSSIVPQMPQAPQPASEFCPPPGLITSGVNSKGRFTITYRGSDTHDGAVCLRTFGGREPGNKSGLEKRFLFGIYDLTDDTFEPEAESGIRRGLGPLLSGNGPGETTFRVALTRDSHSLGRVETWKRLAETDTLMIDGKSVQAVKLQRIQHCDFNSYCDVTGDLWYDPERHIVLKYHSIVRLGRVRIPDMEVDTVSK